MARRTRTNELEMRALSYILGMGLLLGASAPAWAQAPGGQAVVAQKQDDELLRWLRYIAKLEEKAANDPTDYNLYLRIADAYGRLGVAQKEKVLYYATRAVLAGADDARVDIVLGDFYVRVNEPTSAIRSYLRVLAQAPEHTYTLVQLRKLALSAPPATTDVDLGFVRELLAAAGLYLPSKPPKADAAQATLLLEEGYGFIKAEQHEEALARFKAALDLDPKNALAVRGMGIAYAKTKRNRQALAAYAVYLDLNPGAEDAEYVRAIVSVYYESR